MIQPGITDHILFILFGLLIPANSVFRAQAQLGTIQRWDSKMKWGLYLGNSLFLWALAVIILLAWVFQGRALAELGIRMPVEGSWPATFGISFIFLALYGLDVWLETRNLEVLARTRRHWLRHTPFMPVNKKELRRFMLVAFSAAVCEEILFRSFMITYLLALFGESTVALVAAVFIPTLIFAVSHYYQGWNAIAKIALLSLAFGWLFLLSGSILVPVILHLIVDVYGGFLSLRIMPDYSTDGYDEEE